MLYLILFIASIVGGTPAVVGGTPAVVGGTEADIVGGTEA
jgi:hypothetical protein